MDKELDKGRNDLWLNSLKTIGELERELATRNETIGNLQGELRNMQARNAELEAQLQALGVVVDAQNRQLKAIYLTQMVQAHDGFGPVPANPTDGKSYMERQSLLDTDINEV